MVRAVCVISNPELKISGNIYFTQNSESDYTHIKGRIVGASPGEHGFHIHEYGDVTNGCTSAGAHFNPFDKFHGDISDEIRHVGDLGNLTFSKDMVSEFEFVDSQVKLIGPYSVIGRTLVLHADRDDLNRGDHELSPITGNAGPRIACGIIGIGASN